MISEREKQICERLRVFREALMISRSKFSVSCGFGSERIASYESGRAPIPYNVFRAISRKFLLNPFWLAIGSDGGSPRLDLPYDDSAFLGHVPERSLFTWVYDKFISDTLETLRAKEMEHAEKVRLLIKELGERIGEQPHDDKNQADLSSVKVLLASLGNQLVFRDAVARGEKKSLTEYPQMGKTGDVKPILPRLIERLKRATEQRGRKTELAAWLGVSPQKVTDWLSERVEPSGETTLRLLHWVEQQERQK